MPGFRGFATVWTNGRAGGILSLIFAFGPLVREMLIRFTQ